VSDLTLEHDSRILRSLFRISESRNDAISRSTETDMTVKFIRKETSNTKTKNPLKNKTRAKQSLDGGGTCIKIQFKIQKLKIVYFNFLVTLAFYFTNE